MNELKVLHAENTRPAGPDAITCDDTCRHRCPECRFGLGSHLTCDPRCDHHLPADAR
ncbi:hypothetical protein WMO79_00855 [Micrococcaceae bacterium Sec7.4]